MTEPGYLIPARLLVGEGWPRDAFELVDVDALGGIGLATIDFQESLVRATVVVRAQPEITLPGLALLSLQVGRSEAGGAAFELSVNLVSPLSLAVAAPVSLVLNRPVFQPVRRDGELFVIDERADQRVEIGIRGTILADVEGNLSFRGLEEIVVTPFMLQRTGIVVELEDVRLHFGADEPPPEGRPDGWQGLAIGRAAIHLPEEIGIPLPEALAFEPAFVGSGGFSGRAEFRWEDDRTGDLFGMELRPRSIALHFEQSAIVEAALAGELKLPFFDEWLGVQAGFDLNGAFSLALAAPEGDDASVATSDGLLSFTKAGLMTVTVATLGFEKRGDVLVVALSGRARPLLGGLDWPEFELRKLSISSAGDVEIDGGWIDVPEKVTLDFHGFKLDISQVGLGTEGEEDARRQWLGVSGELTLVEGLPLSASVEGLKFSWDPEDAADLDVTLKGIGVELEIPGVLRLEGSVSYDEGGDAERDLPEHIFKGGVKVGLLPLKTEVDGQLMIGRATDEATGDEYTVLYIVLDADLPTPIPLGATGAAMYRVGGLFGLHVSPDRRLTDGEPEPWYEWYRADRGGSGEYSVTHAAKWAPEAEHYAFGARLGLGTHADDGYSLNADALAAVLVPGPMVVIDGRANLLKARGDNGGGGAFHALAVFDGRASTFQLNVDVQWDLRRIISVAGGLEAFFDFNDSRRWYLHLGKREPESKRIQAELLSLFSADSYLMIDGAGVLTGAAIGFDWRADLGPVSLTLVARISFDAGISWNPIQLEGRLALYGELGLRIFGFGIALLLEMLLEGRAPTPYSVHGQARVALGLPWPLPDVDVVVPLSWKEGPPRPDPVEPFLKGAHAIHHKVASQAWELATDEASAPVIPVDSRPVLSFARPISVDPPSPVLSKAPDPSGTLVAVGPDLVGDAEFRYKLLDAHDRRLELVATESDGRETIKRAGLTGPPGSDPPPFQVDDSYLVPAADAQEPGLQLWRTARLDREGERWLESYADSYPPCGPRIDAPTHCVDWSLVRERTHYPYEFRHQGLSFVADVLPRSGEWIDPHVQSGRLRSPGLAITFPEPVRWLELVVEGFQRSAVRLEAFREGRLVIEQETDPIAGTRTLAVDDGREIDTVRLSSVEHPDQNSIALVSICYRTGSELALEASTTRPGPGPGGGDGANGALLLEPNRMYRLSAATETQVDGVGRGPVDATFYFRTADGPGLAPPEASFRDGPLDELASYVARTCPDNGAKRFYYGYDVAVEFNELYVERMYAGPLALRLEDRNGHRVGDSDGAWGSGPVPLLGSALLSWEAVQEASGCPGDGPDLAPTPRLSRRLPSGLVPSHMYTAHIVSEGVDLFHFQFATSLFRDISEHLASGVVDGAQVVRRLGAVTEPSWDWTSGYQAAARVLRSARGALSSALSAPAPDPLSVAEGLEAAASAAATLDDVCAATFTHLDDLVHGRFEELSLGNRPLPVVLEVFQVPLSSEAGSLLLIESPEPIEWHRIELDLFDALGAIGSLVVWNRDKTRAFVFRDDRTWWSPGTYRFAFAFSGAANPELCPITVDGRNAEEAVRLHVTLS